jgi:hypothetical protein
MEGLMGFDDPIIPLKAYTADETPICVCGHTERVHEPDLTAPGEWACASPKYGCQCKEWRPVLTTNESRLFRFKASDPFSFKERHALELGIAKGRTEKVTKVRAKSETVYVDGVIRKINKTTEKPIVLEYLDDWKCWVHGCDNEPNEVRQVPVPQPVNAVKSLLVCFTHLHSPVAETVWRVEAGPWWIDFAFGIAAETPFGPASRYPTSIKIQEMREAGVLPPSRMLQIATEAL